MCVGCLKVGIKNGMTNRNELHCLRCGTPARPDVLDKQVGCEVIYSDGNCLGTQVVGKGISVNSLDTPALEGDGENMVVGDMLKRNCPTGTRILPCAENQRCQECNKGVHI